jgi:hypothetical protein
MREISITQRTLDMKRFFGFLLGLVGLYLYGWFVLYSMQEASMQDAPIHEPQIERTFKMQRPNLVSGLMTIPCEADIIGTVRVRDSEFVARVLAERVLLLEKIEMADQDWFLLRVTPRQAEVLEQAQLVGTLSYALHRLEDLPEEPLVCRLLGRIGLGPRRPEETLTVEDLIAPTTKN